MPAFDKPIGKPVLFGNLSGILLPIIGAIMVLMGVFMYFASGVNDFGAAALKAIPVVHTFADLQVLSLHTEVIVEGHTKQVAPLSTALAPPSIIDLQKSPLCKDVAVRGYTRKPVSFASADSVAAQFGLLAWQKDRFDYKDHRAGSGNPEYWLPESFYYPPLIIKMASENAETNLRPGVAIKDTSTEINIGGSYLLSGALTKVQADTPATRPSLRAGQLGTWRYTGLTKAVTVAILGTYEGSSPNAFRASRIYIGSVKDWYREAQAEGHKGQDVSYGIMMVGFVLLLVGLVVKSVHRPTT